MAISKKVEIIYYNGQPDGIRSIRRHLSTVTAYVIPRPLLAEAKKLSGINRPGIYYLISENSNNKIAQIYIGQTRNGVARLNDHNRSKDFWNKAIMFLADNKTFSLDMISGLEAYAIGKAHASKRYKVENSVNPKYEIDEYDLPLIEEVYEEIRFIMATQGYKMDNSKTGLDEATVLHTTRNGIAAFGVYDGDNFEVLEGSEVDMSRKCHSETMENQRRTALANGDIVCVGGKHKLTVAMSVYIPELGRYVCVGRQHQRLDRVEGSFRENAGRALQKTVGRRALPYGRYHIRPHVIRLEVGHPTDDLPLFYAAEASCPPLPWIRLAAAPFTFCKK